MTNVLSMPEARRRVEEIRKAVGVGVVGQEAFINGLLAVLLANGHALIEGVPGLAKTRAANLLAVACGVAFKRIQFTPDLLPADIVGTQIYNHSTATFETRTGPIFSQLVLADEINRAAPKVQSAMLEAMQERQVTIADKTHPLPRPFLVLATQNPVEQEGTYPLPEAQLDRFLVKLVVGYPSQEEEQQIVRLVMDEVELPSITPVTDASGVLALQAATREVYVEDRIITYATDLVAASRSPERYSLDHSGLLELGASPRASLALVLVGRARALLDGRDSVLPEDIKAAAPDVLRHRLLLTYHAEAEGVTADRLVGEILAAVKVP